MVDQDNAFGRHILLQRGENASIFSPKILRNSNYFKKHK